MIQYNYRDSFKIMRKIQSLKKNNVTLSDSNVKKRI